MQTAIKQYFKEDFLKEMVAIVLYGVAVEMFVAPNQIVTGGITGISLILNNLFSIPIGTTTMVLNLPLFVVGFQKLGRGFIIRTLRIVFLLSVFIDVVMPYFPKYEGEKLLAALFGGVLLGIALAIVLTNGGSTGGTDIIVKLVHVKKPHMSLGNIVMLTDLVIVVLGAIVYRDIETILYGIVLLYVSGVMLDRVVKGSDERWMVLTMSKKGEEISKGIQNEVGRGTTLINATGGYSGDEMPLLLCVVDAREMFALKKVIKRCDPRAFVIVSQAAEILGEGFKDFNN